MDQALKSALDKYNDKLGISTPTNKSNLVNKITMLLAIITAITLVFSVCVRYNFLGAGEVWKWIENISVGEETVGVLIEDVEEKFRTVFSHGEQKTISPVNPNGDSGKIS